MDKFKDWLGQDIDVGDMVLYVTKVSTSAEIRLGRVLECEGQNYLVEWFKSAKRHYLPDGPTKVQITKLTKVPTEWAEGVI